MNRMSRNTIQCRYLEHEKCIQKLSAHKTFAGHCFLVENDDLRIRVVVASDGEVDQWG
jgi:hypothetical protein